mmetsp:Transcript_26725/g.53477  ORF Transcript_26725/g.53477 Transcript_26725/m.53477 type:complete len:220 (+) Transcript_26725:1255-1914(+)
MERTSMASPSWSLFTSARNTAVLTLLPHTHLRTCASPREWARAVCPCLLSWACTWVSLDSLVRPHRASLVACSPSSQVALWVAAVVLWEVAWVVSALALALDFPVVCPLSCLEVLRCPADSSRIELAAPNNLEVSPQCSQAWDLVVCRDVGLVEEVCPSSPGRWDLWEAPWVAEAWVSWVDLALCSLPTRHRCLLRCKASSRCAVRLSSTTRCATKRAL